MTRDLPGVEFFVVGGSVQPGRACYIEREADAGLREHLRNQRFPYVLGPRAIGKSSLMARVVQELRAEGQRVAVVDLDQIAARGESAEAGRWYYGIAYRIVRQLRLKFDLQSWWQQHSALLGEQRLAEFFWDVVLTNTTAPIAIFIDDIERTVDLPFAGQLFTAIRGCYTNRTTEPDFARLNFAVLGEATPADLCPDPSLSPFELGRAVNLDDFSVEATYRLAPGFDLDREQACALLERIHAWTDGHPYLTQKIARGVVRRGSSIEAVERTIREQFLTPGAAQGEPLLTHMRGVLTRRSAIGRQALALLGKVAREDRVRVEPASRIQQALDIAGVVRRADDGTLRMRNPVFAAVFTSRWVHSALPMEWRRLGLAAAVIVVLAAVPIWYVRYLPQPYIRTLNVAIQDSALVEEAFQKLHRLPGFRNLADRLMVEALQRRSRQTDSWAELLATDTRLRQLPDGPAAADAVLGEYWLRRAQAAARAERRDEALVLAGQAAAGQPEAAAALRHSLVDSDYPFLVRSTQLGVAPAYWAVDWAGGLLTVVDAAHRVHEIALAPDVTARVAVPDRLTAVQHVPLARELPIDATGSAGEFTLELVVDHPDTAELGIALVAPGGARAQLEFPETRVSTTRFQFTATARTALGSLADESRQGTWRLIVTDRRVGNTGALRQWGLRFAAEDEFIRDVPEQGIALPDPVRTEQASLVLSRDGRLAIAQPARAGAVGALTVWDLHAGQRRADLPLAARPEFLELTGDGRRLVVATGPTLTLWDTESGAVVARVTTQSSLAALPALDPKGEYLVMAERVDAQTALVSLLAAADGRVLASVAGPAEPRQWVLGPDASYVAVAESSRVLRAFDPRSGRILAEWPHGREITRLVTSRSGARLLAVDTLGDIWVWQIHGVAERAPGEAWHVGTTIDAGSVSMSADGRTLAFEATEGQLMVRDSLAQRELKVLRVDESDAIVRTRLAPDGGRLLSLSSARAQLWNVPPGAPVARNRDEIALASVDPGGSVLAVGLRDGRVRFSGLEPGGAAAPSAEVVDFIGHQGVVTALSVDAARMLAVSGGADGVVRLWNPATGSPTARFLRHPAGPITAVAQSPDGHWVVSAAEYSARLWQVSDGRLLAEVPVNGAALAVAFADGAGLAAVGDSAGNVFFVGVTPGSMNRSLRAPAAVTALRFTPDPELLLVGDRAGQVQLWNVARGEPVFEPYWFRHPVRWIGLAPDAASVVVQTDHWLHRLRLTEAGFEPIASRLAPIGAWADGTALAADGTVLLAIRDVRGNVAVEQRVLERELPPAPGGVETSRDWSQVLGLRVAEDGRLVPQLP